MKFHLTSKLNDAITIVNNIPSEKFPLILQRVIEKLDGKNVDIFTENEKVQLQQMLNLSEYDLHSFLSVIIFIFQQSAYYCMKEDDLVKSLQEIKIQDESVCSFRDIWSKYGYSYTERLRNIPMGAPKLLVDSNYRIQLEIGSSETSEQVVPRAVLGLKVQDESKPNQPKEAIEIEYTHDELYHFFLKLEDIQKQFDSLI